MQEQVMPSAYAISGRSTAPSSESSFITHHDIKRFLKRYAKTIVTATLLGILVSSAYVVFTVPLYTARTQIIIDPSLPQAMQQSHSEGIFTIDNAQVESQLEVLRSEKIATAVIDELKLQDVPEFSVGGPSLLSLPFRLLLPQPGPPTDFEKQRITLAIFDAGLNVRRLGVSYAIDIMFSSRSPELAAKIANATANAYINEQISARAQAARQGGLWLEERIDQLRSEMNSAAFNAQEFRAKRDYRIAAPHVGANDGRPEPNPARDSDIAARHHQNTMEELDSTAQTYRRIYESYLMAYTESVQKQSYPVTNARVITEATPPLSKSHPKTKLILAFGALMGCLAGLGIAFFRNSIDRCVWGARQIRDEVGVECLASIPRLAHGSSTSAYSRIMFGKAVMENMIKAVLDKPSPAIDGSGKSLKSAVSVARSTLGRLKGAQIVPAKAAIASQGALDAVLTLPFSSFSHGVKTLKTAISLAGRRRQIHSFAVTSALPNEGKTTICANLATLFAMSGVRTLLIDGDVRNASLTRSLAPEAEFGLIEAISGDAEVAQCIIRMNESGLDLLPAFGTMQTPSDDILGSEKAQRLLQELQSTYDLVIVEMPPLTASLDGLAMGSLLDCTMLVAEWGKTPMPLLSEALHLLRSARTDILGVVLNKVDSSTVHYGDVAANYLSYAPASPASLTRRA
jgi:capsular exopolysaccharide synthesis family protein